MKIALDVSCLIQQPLTGVGYYTLNQVQALIRDARDVEIQAFASSAQGPPQCLAALAQGCAGSKIVGWPTRLKTLLWTRFEWPPIEWFTGPVDIAHGAFHLLPPSRGAKRMVTVFDLSAVRHPEMHSGSSVTTHRALLRHAVSRADALVAISESCKTDLIECLGARPERVHVAYGGVSLEEFDGAGAQESPAEIARRHGIEGPYLIHLGTLEPRKNLPRLIEAYARLKAKHPECPKLVLAGHAGWMFEPVFETIQRLRLSEAVVHTGYLTRAEAVGLLRGAYACVYPSLYEGFGVPVLEAMAARVPVLTSNVSSLPEVIGDTGILVDPGSVDAIEAGLVDLLVRRDEALARTGPAYERAAQFTWSKSARALAGVYRMLMEEGES